MTAVGKRDRRVEIQRKMTARTPEGVHEGVAWVKVQGGMARVFYGTGAERRSGAAEGATQVATFNMISTAALRGVTVADHRIFDLDFNQAWDITATSHLGRKEIDFTATQVRA